MDGKRALRTECSHMSGTGVLRPWPLPRCIKGPLSNTTFKMMLFGTLRMSVAKMKRKWAYRNTIASVGPVAEFCCRSSGSCPACRYSVKGTENGDTGIRDANMSERVRLRVCFTQPFSEVRFGLVAVANVDHVRGSHAQGIEPPNARSLNGAARE
jgi:hypothetical protein